MKSTILKSHHSLCLSFLTISSFLSVSAEPNRSFQVSDLFRLEQLGGDHGWLGGPTFSPNGQSCIFEHVRALNTCQEVVGGSDWIGTTRSDLWLLRQGENKPQRLTDGVKDKCGSWKSFWSPDSQQVLFYSTKGTSKADVRPMLWLWDAKAGTSRRLSARSINQGLTSVWWMGSNHVLCDAASDDDDAKLVDDSLRATELATDHWSNIWSGKVATVNLIESGITNASKTNKTSFNVLTVIDTGTGKETTVDQALFYNASISPDGSCAAILRDPDAACKPFKSFVKASLGGDLEGFYEIVGMDGRIASTPGLSNIVATGSTTPAWTSDGARFAFIQVTTEKETTNHNLAVYDIATDQVSPMLFQGVQPSGTNKLYWLENKKWVFQARAAGGTSTSAQTNRADWYMCSPEAAPQNLTTAFTNTVDCGNFFHEEGKDSFVCCAQDAVWRIYTDGRPPLRLSASITQTNLSFLPPVGRAKAEMFGINRQNGDLEIGTSVVVESKNGTTNHLFCLDLQSDQIHPISKPSAHAELADYVPSSGSAIFVENDSSGSRVWRTNLKEQQPPVSIAEANTFLANIRAGEQSLVEYDSLDGKPLKAWIVLPANYERGKKYPTVLWVYAGSVCTGAWRPADLNEPGELSPFNLQLMASRGYAVLFPSMPLKPDGEADDPLLELTKGVLPAIDKLVALGIADPERIGVMGHSYGGYSTMGLVTQTRRFKAAVSLAGDCDLISTYGTFGGSVRYHEDPNEEGGDFAQIWSMGQGRMMNPPWKDLGRYLKNSPITFVDRVETPLLIIQGDMDFVPIQQGEEFFQALYKQGKRAEFARYWGEGHVFTNPANVEDMWNRIFRWFDMYLKDQSVN